MNDDDYSVAAELAQILRRRADLLEMAQFDPGDKIDSETTIQRLRLMGKTAEADELGELMERTRELEREHRTKN